MLEHMKALGLAAIAWSTMCASPLQAKSAVFWVSGPVHPGEAVLVTGYFPQPGSIDLRVANVTRARSDWQTQVTQVGVQVKPLKATQSSTVFVLPNIGGDGVYAFRLNQPGEPPIYAKVNLPEIWWTLAESQSINPEIKARVAEDSAEPGALLRIFGRSLISGATSPDVRLTSESGKSTQLSLSSADSYELVANIPKDLLPGLYSLSVGSSSNASGGTSAPHRLNIQSQAEKRLAQFNLLDFSKAETEQPDYSAALESAIAKAVSFGGGVVRIPAGNFPLTHPIDIPPNVYLVGEGPDRTALYFPDVDSPPAAWINGTHNFGLENLAIFCGNHNAIVSSDMTGKPEKSGHVRLRNVLIRGNAFRGHPTSDLASSRLALIMNHSGIGFEAVRLSGSDLIVEDCDIQGSSRSLYVYGGHGAIIRRNQLHNGALGWYNFSVSDGVIIEKNLIRGEGLLGTGGSYSTWGEPRSSRNIYTANNTYSEILGWDREAFTTDGGGGAYFGSASQAERDTLILAADPEWGKDDWTGALAAVIAGHGVGEWREVKSWTGRHVTFVQSVCDYSGCNFNDHDCSDAAALHFRAQPLPGGWGRDSVLRHSG